MPDRAYNKNVNVAMSTIAGLKESLQKEFNISDQHYNKIAKIALGLIDSETKQGVSGNYLLKNALHDYKLLGISALTALKVVTQG
jgi:hypothetical protein